MDKSIRVLFSALCLGGFSSGCSFVTTEPSATPVTISGKVQLGPVSGASVKLYCLNSDGSRSGNAIATASTDAQGVYKFEVRSELSCPLVIASTGGSYEEEADGSIVALTAEDELSSIIGEVDSSSAEVQTSVTALTDLAAKRFEAINESFPSGSSAEVLKHIERSKEEIRQTAGLPDGVDITRVVPADPFVPLNNAESIENKVALVLAGMSEIAKSGGQNSFQLSKKMATDLKDGVVDDEKWTDLHAHINTWVVGSRNTGGHVFPSQPIVPVSMPIPNPTRFPFLTENLPPPFAADRSFFTSPARIVVNPVSSFILSSNSPCMGPFKIQLFTRRMLPATFSADVNLAVKISNQPLDPNGQFSIHSSATNCSAGNSAITSIRVPSGQSEVDVWLRTTNKHFAYPVDLFVVGSDGKLPPNFLTIHTGETSTASAVPGRLALRWQRPSSVLAGTCAGPFHIQTIDSTGVSSPATERLDLRFSRSSTRGNAVSTGTLKFFSDPECTTALPTVALAAGATTTQALFATIPAGASIFSLNVESPNNSVLGHEAGGLHVHGLVAHAPIVPSSLPQTAIPIDTIQRLRLFTQYSGGSAIQETIDFSANTIQQITSGLVTVSTCDVSATAVQSFATFVAANGLCSYGSVSSSTLPCVYGSEMAIDVTASSVSSSRLLSATETCRYAGARTIVDFCSQTRAAGLKKISEIYASKVNCR